MHFGAAYYPEHRDPDKWEFDLDLMAEANVTALRVGEFAWKRFEPQAGVYDFRWMDRFLELAAARGIGLLMCPPIRTAPAWLMAKDPTIAIETADGIRLGYGSRYTFCINHPLLRERGFALAWAMARHWAGAANLLGWHLDNEYGDEPDCHCPVCTATWRQWLAERYDGIADLNARWGTVFWGLEFDSFEQVPTPRVTKAMHNPGLLQAWRRFRSDCTVETISLHAQAVREAGSAEPITTNFQALWNARTDYYAAAGALDVCGTNYYPPYGPHGRAAAFGLTGARSYKQQNFHVHELRNGPHAIPGRADNTPAPGEITRLTLHAIGHGADAVFYFRWRGVPFGPEQSHGTLVDYAGRPLPAYHEAKAIGANLRRLGDLLEGTTVRSEVAILWDYPTRWMTETGSPWEGPKSLYKDRCVLVHEAVRACGVNCDAVGRDRNLSRYKVLIVPRVEAMDEDLVMRLGAFVEAGGVLVWHAGSGIRDADACIYPQRLHPALGGLFGVDVRRVATGGPDQAEHFVYGGRMHTGRLLFELPELQGARSAGEYVESWFAHTPAVTTHQVEAGLAVYVATFPDRAFYDAFLPDVFAETGIQPILGTRPPEAVEVIERTAADGRRLVFVLSYSDEPQSVPLPAMMRDVWNECDVEGQLALGPHGSAVLTPRT